MHIAEWLLPMPEGELWVAEQGAGPPLLLLSGGPGCCDYLGPASAMLDDVVRVYRCEPRGCGRSYAPPPYDVETCVADLERLRVATGHERWLVGGHSWGCNVALAYALTHPKRVQALLLLASAGVQDDRQWHAAYERGRDEGREQMPDFDLPFNPEVNRAGNASWRRFIKRPALFRRLADLQVPALLVSGSVDIRPTWPAEQLAALLPDARFRLIDGAGHYLWLTHADELRRALRDFLLRLLLTST